MTATAITPETLPAIMWQNQPVITTELLAQIYGAQEKQIRQNFANNTSRFIEGVHFFKLVGAELKAFKRLVDKIDSAIVSKFTQSLMLWTELGTVRHAKILDTDNAWAVQDRLEDFYFAKHQTKPAELPPAHKTLTSAMLRHIEKRIAYLNKTQVGSTYEGLGRLIKETFNVHKRDQIPVEKYPEVCALLGCEPDPKALQGELVEFSTVPAGMTLVAVDELEKLKQLAAPSRADELLASPKLYTIAEIVGVFNEIAEHDLAIVPKQKILALKKALENVF